MIDFRVEQDRADRALARRRPEGSQAPILQTTKGIPISTSASSPEIQTPPAERDELLSQVGPAKVQVYRTVRQILDRMDEAAPWDQLYYPSSDTKIFMAMEAAFLDVVREIPKLVKVLTDGLEDSLGAEEEQLLGDARFFFQGIHENVAFDIHKLSSKIKALSVSAGSIDLTRDERAFTCEITADLKGKYASSIMGAAAAIIADGRWNGVAIEPILFPEKREEFERNALLVSTLTEVVTNIKHLLEDLPLAELVGSWRDDERVDQYALTSLYSFLGNLGKLMKGKCRRALYSGDYHQIQKRESLLSARINELTTLHNVTWGTVPAAAVPGGDAPFPGMIQRATELAAILDINILREIIGDRTVKDLLSIVTIERERRKSDGLEVLDANDEPEQKSSLRKNLPDELHSLIPLMYDEDLQNFLSLLLGSVQKRASLAVTREAAAPAPAAGGGAKLDLAAELDFDDEQPADPPQRLEKPGTLELSPEDLALEVPDVQFDAANPFESVPDVEFDDPGGFLNSKTSESEGEAEDGGILSVPDDAFDPIDWNSDASTEEAEESPSFDTGNDAPSFDTGNEGSSFDFGIDSDPTFGAGFGGSFADDGDGTPEIEDTIAAFEEAAELAEVSVVDSGPPLGEKLRLLRDLQGILRPLKARTNAHRKSYELVHRLLKQKKVVPPAMLESMHPYLYDVMNRLIPQLHQLADVPEISPDHSSNLIEYCTFLCNKDLGPQHLREAVPNTMEHLLRLLDGLNAITDSLIRDLDPLA